MSNTVEYYCDTCKKTYEVVTKDPVIPTQCICVKCRGQVWLRGIKERDEKAVKK